MKGWLFISLISLILLTACGGKDDDALSGAQAPNINNAFTDQFPVVKLKYNISDTSLDRAEKNEPLKFETNKYFPESLILDYFDNGQKITYYPLGKVQNNANEIYVIMKAVSGLQKAAYVLVYDNQLNYKDGSMICQTDGDPKTSYLASIDKYFNIAIRRIDYIKGEDAVYNEIFLAYNNSGKLGQVVTNATAGEIDFINPIDTFPATKKYTGDYYLDNNNMISLRDDADSGKLMLFFKYEKTRETCEGEIKDYLRFIDATHAVYQKDGDPCGIEFAFNGNSITIKEGADCGNKKGSFDCSLNGTFTKRERKKVSVDQTEVINPLGAKPPTTPSVDPNAPKVPEKPKVKGIPASAELEAARKKAELETQNPDLGIPENPNTGGATGKETPNTPTTETGPTVTPAQNNGTPATVTPDKKTPVKPKVDPKKPVVPAPKKPLKQKDI